MKLFLIMLFATTVLLSGCVDSRISCFEIADTEAQTAACTELYSNGNSEYQGCLEAGGSWVEKRYDESCIVPGSESLLNPEPYNYSAAIILSSLFLCVTIAFVASSRRP